jgi:predicted  nucleic acid-binding Zn-ribbon protein
MKTQKQIQQRIKEIQDRLDDAERNQNYKEVPNFVTYRTLNTQINTLAWVLDDTKKTLGGKTK